MNVLTAFSTLLLVGAFAAPAGITFALERTTQPEAVFSSAIARAGGGGRVGGGSGGGRATRGHTGFSGAGGGLNRGSSRPTGGWTNNVGTDRARPSMDRPAANRALNRDGTRELSRDGSRTISRDVNRDVNRTIDRNWGRTINIGDVDLYPGWARPGWGVARPWNYGWYGGWSTPAWGWWGARAAAWGVGALATAAVINNAVDAAVSDHMSYIVVPNTDYQLLYGTVQPTSGSSITFDVTANGSIYRLTADCNAGYLNGREPSSASQAELLNAACQVAYGSV